jgi:hypothetical protein
VNPSILHSYLVSFQTKYETWKEDFQSTSTRELERDIRMYIKGWKKANTKDTGLRYMYEKAL